MDEGVISTVINGTTVLLVGNRLLINKNWKTFCDFLDDYIKDLLGTDWWTSECNKNLTERHIIVQWAYKKYEFQNKVQKQENGFFKANPTGAMAGYYHIAYDLYLVEKHGKLNEKLIKRIKIPDQFQGARYELFALTTCLRAGLDIEYSNENDISKKHPEFFIIDQHKKERIAVEVKSRVRPGVLGQPGNMYNIMYASMGNLFRDAIEKNLEFPYIIFLDLNLPPSNIEHLLKQVSESVLRIITAHPSYEEIFNLIVFTNIPHYFGSSTEPDPEKYFLWTFSKKPRFQISQIILNKIIAAAQKYQNIPNVFFTSNFL